MGTCPSWIIRCDLALSALRLFYPNEPTFIVRFGMSQTCQQRSFRNRVDRCCPHREARRRVGWYAGSTLTPARRRFRGAAHGSRAQQAGLIFQAIVQFTQPNDNPSSSTRIES